MNPKRFVLLLFIIAFIALANAFLTGCATKPKQLSPQFSAPAATKVETSIRVVKDSLTTARSKAAEVQAVTDTPLVRELVALIESANAEATRTQVELTAYSKNVATQTDLLNSAVDQKNEALVKAEYWHGKHSKALWEIWFWRGLAALITGSIAVWFALKMGIKLL